MENHNLLEEAIKYVNEYGWSLIPIAPKSKEPPSKFLWKKYQNIIAEPEEIKEWFNKYPGMNIAVVTGKISSLTVIDVDPRNGGSFEPFNRLTTVTSNTGGHGKHYYCDYDENIPSTDLKNGIEFKNNGRYIVLPPSIHPNGNKYVWSMSPFAKTPFASFPDFAKAWLKQQQTTTTGRFNHEILKGVAEGSRNVSAASLTGKLLLICPPEEWETVVWPYLVYWNSLNSKPLTEGELRKTYISICKREWQKRSKGQSLYNSDRLTKELTVLPYKSFIDLQFPPNEWLIQGLIPKNGITCISGQPKVGKSIVTLNLAICLAKGEKFLNHFDLEGSNILYISKDEPPSLTQDRLIKMVNNKELDIPITFITDNSLYFDTDENIQKVKEIITSREIKVIIIDSFRRIFKGDENSSQIINEVQQRLKQLQETGVTIIFIHHHGKEGFFRRPAGDKLRGSSDILAMLDALIFIEKVGDEKLKLTQGVLRNDKTLEPFIVEMNTLLPGQITLEFNGFIKEEDDKKDKAKADILSLLKENSEQDLNQTGIIKSLQAKTDYSKTTIKNAFKELEQSKQIVAISKGNQKIYKIQDHKVT